jgi:hypothetical protein
MKKPQKKSAAEKRRSDSDRRMIGAHIRELQNFVRNIMDYAEEPANWPLTQPQQIAFVRSVMGQARKIQQSEEYEAAAIWLVTKDVEMANA